MINAAKLSKELVLAGITNHGNCNSKGVVLDDDNNEIQNRPEVKEILAAHDPTPEIVKSDKEIIIELQSQVAVLSKAVDTSKLSSSEVEILQKELSK